jgi:hypothetical protein
MPLESYYSKYNLSGELLEDSTNEVGYQVTKDSLKGGFAQKYD